MNNLKKQHYDERGSGVMQQVCINLVLTFKMKYHGCV